MSETKKTNASLLASFKRSAVLKGVVKISGGTLLGQGAAIVSAPILTRLFSPSEFGVLGIYAATAAIIAIVASLRYDQAIPVVSDEEYPKLAALSFVSLMATTLLSAVGVIVLWPHLSGYVGEASSMFAWLLPVGIFAAAAYQLLNAIAIRHEEYGLLGRTKVYQGVSMVVTQLGLGFLGGGYTALLLGDIAGKGGGLGTLIRARKKDIVSMWSMIGSSLGSVARKYARYPLYIGSATLLSSASLYMPYFILQGMYGASVVGLFLLVQRIVSTPTSLIGKAVANVYYGRAADAVRSGDSLARLQRRGIKALLAAGLPFAVVAVIFAEVIFVYAFGPEWREAGRYVQVLTPAYLANFVLVPFSQTFNLLDIQHLQLLTDGVRFALSVCAFGLAYYFQLTAYATVMMYSAALLISYLFLYIAMEVGLRRLTAETA